MIRNFATFLPQDTSESSDSSGTPTVGAHTGHDGFWLTINPSGSGLENLKFDDPNDGTFSPLNISTIYITFRFYVETFPASNGDGFFSAQDAGGTHKFALYLNSNGTFQVLDANFNSLGTSSTTLTTGTEYWVQLQAASGSGNAVGITVKVLDASGGLLETMNLSGTLGSNTYSHIRLGKSFNFNSVTYDVKYSRLVIDDAQLQSPWTPGIKLIAADGSADSWTGSTPHWQQVDDIPADDNTYLTSPQTLDAASMMALQTNAQAGIAASSIRAVRLFNRAISLSGSGQTRQRLISDATTVTSTTRTSPPFNEAFSMIFNEDPATSSAWAPEALDDVEIGIVERSTTHSTRWTSGCLLVIYTASAGQTARGRVLGGGVL